MIYFIHVYYIALLFHHDLKNIYKKIIPLTVLTNRKHVFDFMTKGTNTEERRLKIYISISIEAHNC